MSGILFVHGIGVRDAQYEPVMGHLQQGVRRVRPDLPVDFCYWGSEFGAVLAANGQAVPTPRRTDTAQADLLPDDPVEMWDHLRADPVAELRTLAAVSTGRVPVPVGSAPPREEIEAALRALPDDVPLRVRLTSLGLDAPLKAAVTTVLHDPVTQTCLGRVAAFGDTITVALARAVVASLLARVPSDVGDDIAADAADDLVNAVADRIALRSMAAGAIVSVLSELRLGWWLERQRDTITAAVTPWLGDIVRYLAHGADLREHIAAAVERHRPRVLLGHSLGGVACLELLVDKAIPSVEMLITVGSQASFLYEIDALPTLRRGQRLPQHFPAWVNVYDPRDMVAFRCGVDVLGSHVADHRIDNGAPFPRAHSRYFRNRRFYDLLGKVLP